MLKITKVYPNSPAFQADLSPGLIVQKVDDIPTSGKSMIECLGLIRGKAGTTVRLELVELRVVVWVNLRWKSHFKGLFAGEILVFVRAQTGYA